MHDEAYRRLFPSGQIIHKLPADIVERMEDVLYFREREGSGGYDWDVKVS
ncbi:MAG: hypothetical protein QXU11_12470 [Thermoproteota archaeon]